MSWARNRAYVSSFTDSRLRGNDGYMKEDHPSTKLMDDLPFLEAVILNPFQDLFMRSSMLLKCFFIAFTLIFSLSLHADMPYISQENGDDLLKKGEYDKAIEYYEDQVKQGLIGHQLFFNLGTAYAKKGVIDKALLNFEKALRLKPLDKTTQEQITQLNLQLQDKPPIYEDTGLLAFFKKVQFSLSIDTWAFLSILFMIMLPVVIFISYKFKNIKSRQLIFLSSIVWFLLSGFSVLMARNSYHFKYLHTEGIVHSESIKVFDRSDPNSGILFNLHTGTKVEIDDSTSNMYHIQFAEKKGWIINKDVQKIEL